MKRTKQLSGLAVVFAIVFLLYESIQPPRTFQETKVLLTRVWDSNNFTTEFYCHAPFAIENSSLRLIESEAYSPRKLFTNKHTPNERAKIIEFEHIMPAQNFGQHLECWKNGGRKACKNDVLFNKMEADPYNLVPAIGEINGDRSNYKYAEAPRDLEYTQYGNCKVYTDFKAKRFYPADYSKGLIARTYLYMSETYNIRLSEQERKLMESWDKMYPKDSYELQRDELIKQITVWKIFIKLQDFVGI